MSDPDRLELSAQDLMPSWVTNLEKSLSDGGPRQEPRHEERDGGGRDDHKGRGRGKGGRGGGGGGRQDRRWDDDRSKGGGRGDRRGGPRGKGAGDRRGQGRGRGDRFDDRQRRPVEEAPPQGISVSLAPDPNAAAALARHIRTTGRTYAVADLARMVLGARERYRLHFRSENADQHPLFVCEGDQSVWLTRDEAVAHVLHSSALEHYYEVEEVAVEPPKGNFSVVAVCGMSGQILGPPNHHEYPMNVSRLHRERFADMPFERFKSRIEMKRDEETLEKWQQLVSTRRQYRVKPEPGEPEPAPEPAETPDPQETEAVATDETIAESEAPAGNAEASASGEAAEGETAPESESAPAEEGIEPEVTSADADEVEAGDETESANEDAGEPAAEAPAEEPAAPTPANDGEVLTSSEALERHFRSNYADEAVKAVADAVIPGNIPGRAVSRPLLNLLKSESEKARKSFPLAMIQHLCREFEKAGLKFFKRGKKALHVSVARPRAIENESDFTERVRQIVGYVREHPKARVVDLLDALVSDYQKPAKGESFQEHHLTQAEHDVLADLRWLTMEGYVIEFPTTELVLGRMEPAPAKTPAKAKSKSAKTKKKSKPKTEKPTGDESTEAQPETEVQSGQPEPTTEAGSVATDAASEGGEPEIAAETETPSPSAEETPPSAEEEGPAPEAETTPTETTDEAAASTPPETPAPEAAEDSEVPAEPEATEEPEVKAEEPTAPEAATENPPTPVEEATEVAPDSEPTAESQEPPRESDEEKPPSSTEPGA